MKNEMNEETKEQVKEGEAVTTETPEAKAPREYIAFISYRHKELDKKIAKKVHTMVERYVIPKELRGKDGAKKLGKVFRDEEELPVSSNLTESIQTALDHSKFLIVVCTPNTPESIWVEREITYFIEKHGRDHVVGILVDGTPDQSFPKPLTQALELDHEGNETIREVEPLAANLTDVNHKYKESRIRKEAVRLYAALLGCPFDSLWQREKRQKMRNLVAVMALAMVIALSFSASIYMKNREINARNIQIEEQNEQIQTQNEEIKEQYVEIQDKNSDLKRSEAEALIRSGELLYEKGDMRGAMQNALLAVSTPEGREVCATDAEFLLYRAMGTGQYENALRTVGVIDQDEDLRGIMLSEDGSRLYTLGGRSYVRCYSTESCELLWLGDAMDRSYQYDIAQRQRMHELKDQGILLVCMHNQIVALSLEDGSQVWRHQMSASSGADFSCLSSDGKLMAVMDSTSLYLDRDNVLRFIETSNGDVVMEAELPDVLKEDMLASYGNIVGAFSENNRYFTGMIFTGRYSGADRVEFVFLVDMETLEVKILREESMASFNYYPFTVGMLCHEDSQCVLAMFYDPLQESVRMDQIFFDGKIGESSAFPISLPQRGMTRPYDSTFVLEENENNALMASCQSITFLYRMDNGLLVNTGQSASENILVRTWIDPDNYAHSSLSVDGNHYAFYGIEGYSMSPFSEKKHIALMSITDHYARSNGGYGFCMDENVVQAVVRDDNTRRIFLQKQAKDPSLETPEWSKALIANDISYAQLEKIDDNTLLAIEYLDDDEIVVHYIDVTTAQEVKSYRFNLNDIEEDTPSYMLREGFFWKDQRHVTIKLSSMRVVAFDLETKQMKDLFESSKLFAATRNYRMADGRVLQAVLEYRGGWSDPADTISWKIDDEESGTFQNDGDEKWIGSGVYSHGELLWVGAQHYVMTAYFEGEESIRKGFVAYDVTSGKKYVIPEAEDAPETEGKVFMGEQKGIFAVMDDDGKLRIYDIATEKLANVIDLPAGQVIAGVTFGNNDGVIGAYSLDGRLYLFDVQSGNKLMECEMGEPRENLLNTLKLTCYDDPARNRLLFTVSGENGVCVETKDWKQTMILYNEIDAFFPSVNQMFKINRDTTLDEFNPDFILCHKADTLDDLIAKAKELLGK
ncbi:MAG: TIR domain-containing protein [Lachnospiraceae bacterium]|nr:TIR domain-containing protein [Lachnospiraceae bacterium]